MSKIDAGSRGETSDMNIKRDAVTALTGNKTAGQAFSIGVDGITAARSLHHVLDFGGQLSVIKRGVDYTSMVKDGTSAGQQYRTLTGRANLTPPQYSRYHYYHVIE
jgi:hypothetical protein